MDEPIPVKRAEKILLLAVFVLVVPPLVFAMFGLLIYPAIWETIRTWFG